MPYSSAKEVPSNVPAGKKRQFMAVFNSVYSDTKDEGRAMAAAYSAIKKAISTGDRVSWNSSGGTARGIVRQIVRDGTVPNIPVKITGSEDEPAARIEIVDDEGKPTGQMVGHKLSTLRKAKYANDIFTTPEEAYARSMDMGFEGKVHVHEYMGQAVYMPAEDHEEYLEYYEELVEGPESASEDDQEGDYSEGAEGGSVDRLEALRAVVAEILKTEFQKAEYQGREVTLNKPRRIQGGNKKFEVFVMDGDKVKRVTFGDPNMEIRRDDPKARANFRSRHSCDTASDKTSARYWSCRMWESDTSVSEMTKANIEGKILKADDEQRMVYGWASVVTEKGEPVVDRQGDVIEPETLVKAVNNFMEHIRVGKAMHTGEQVGVVVHSFPVTKELGDALGIHSDREGWIVAYKVYDDAVWNMVKSGELAAFSIGGRAMKEEI
jgi:cation transport regulator ChaB